MKHRNLKLLGLWLALALLVSCFLGGAALAEDAEPAVSITVANAEIVDGAVSGKNVYKVYIDVSDPEVSGLEMAWVGSADAAEPEEDWFTYSLEWLRGDDEGSYLYIWGGTEPDLTEETMFLRLPGDEASTQKLSFHYNHEIAEAATAITTGSDEPLAQGQPLTLNWQEVEGADLYVLEWHMPNRDWFLSLEEGTSYDIDSLDVVGDYEAWVVPVVDGLLGAESEHVTFTVPAPEADERVSLSADRDEEDGVIHVAANEWIEFFIASNDEEAEIRDARIFNGYEWQGTWEEDGVYRRNERLNDGGRFTLYAQVTFDEWQDEYEELEEDPRNWVYTNALTVEVDEPVGQVGMFSITVPESAPRGEVLEIPYTDSENAEVYELYLWCEEEGVDYNWDWRWDEEKHVLRLYTGNLPEGHTYQIAAGAYAVGYQDNHTDFDGNPTNELTITEPQIEEGTVVFTVDQTEVETRQDFDFYIYAPGAERIDLSSDYDEDEWWEDWGGSSVVDSRSYGRSGEYKLVARAWYPVFEEDGETPVYEINDDGEQERKFDIVESEPYTITVTAPGGELEFGKIEVPAYLNEGEGIEVTFPMPENADYLEASIWVEGWDGDLVHREIDGEYGDSITLSLSGEDLAERGVKAGDVIGVDAYASAPGYEATDWEKKIPVLGEPSDQVFLDVEDEELLDEDGVVNLLVNQSLDLVLTSADGRPIRDAYFFNGEREEWGNKDWDEEDRVRMWTDFGEGGEYVVYAGVTFEDLPEDFDWDNQEDPREWVTTNSFIVRVPEALGEVGEFTISSDVDTAERMQDVEIAFTESENATQWDLWIDPVDENGEDIDLDFDRSWEWKDEEGGVAVLHTATMPAGRYRLVGYASAPGYRDYATDENDNVLYLTVTEPELPESGILFTVNGESEEVNLVTNEEYTVSAYAPGASWIDLYFDWDDNRDWRDDRGGESFSWNRSDYGSSGDYTMVAQAWYPESDETKEASIAVHVTAPNGKLSFDSLEVPGVVRLGEDLNVVISMPENADYMSGWINDDDLEDGNLYYFDMEREDGRGHTMTATAADMEAKGVKANDIIHIHIDASGYGYEDVNYDKNIPVIREVSDEVEIVFGEEEDVVDGVAQAQVNDGVNVIVRATVDKEIKTIRLYDGYNFWNDDCPDDDGQYSRDPRFGEAGEYSVYAMVTFDDVPEDWDWEQGEPRTWVQTDALSIKVAEPKGKVGAFTIKADKTEVERTDDVEIIFTKSENAESYTLWCNPIDEEGNDIDLDWQYNWEWKDEEGGVAVVHTAGMPVGQYRLVGNADAPGYENYSTDEDDNVVILTVNEVQLPESGILLKVNGQTEEVELLSGEQFDLSIFAPGAQRIEFFWNWDNQGEDWGDSRDGDSVTEKRGDYGNSGEYTLVARAWYDEENHSEDSMTVKVNSYGQLEFDMSDLPSFLEAGKDATVTIRMPENGQTINYQLYMEKEDWFDEEDRWELIEDDYGIDHDVEITFKGENLVADRSINLNFQAFAEGYDSAGAGWNMPVKAASDERVSLTTDPEDLSEVLVHQNICFYVQANGDDNVTAARFYIDNNWQDPDGDEDGRFYRNWGFGEAKEYSVYAEAQLNGADEWITTNSVTFTAKSNGEIGQFDFEDPSDRTVSRGDIVRFTFADAEHAEANSYWVEVYDDNDNWFDPGRKWEDHACSFSTANMEPGVYRIEGWAGGEGYTDTKADSTLTLTVVEAEPGTVKLTLDKNDVPVFDDTEIHVFAPDAVSLVLTVDGDEFGPWDIEEAWDGWLHEYVDLGHADEYTFTATVTFRDSEETATSEPVTVTVYTDGDVDEFDNSEIPASFTAGQENTTVTIKLPGNADWFNYQISNDEENWDEHNEGFDSDQTITIPSEWLEDGKEIFVNFQAFGTGLNMRADGVIIPVHAWGEPTYAWSSDNKSVTATRKCAGDGEEETETVEATAEVTKAATCEAKGETTYTAKFANKAFATQTKTVEDIAALGHDYGEPTYAWSSDNSTVTGTITCKHDASHKITEEVKTQSKVTKEATYTAKGETTYTATFTKEGFATQTKVVADIDMLSRAEADAAIAKISALPANAGTADKAAVEAARAAYNALPEGQKALVDASTLQKLTNAESQVKAAEEAEKKAAEEKAAAEKKAAEDKAAADAVIAKIDALPATAGTGDKAAVEAARAAYEALTADQKKQVSESALKKLATAESQEKAAEEAEKKAAEEKAAAEKKAAEDKAAADAVIAKIDALPATAGAGDKAAVEAARAAYDALTADQKKLVSDSALKKLTSAESRVKAATEIGAGTTFQVKPGVYKVNSDGTTVTFTKPVDAKSKSVTIPATVTYSGKKFKVTAIADKAFNKNKYLTTVSIGSNVKTIGKNAFNACVKLATVKGGAGVETIGESAFQGDKVLKAFTIGKKVKTIGKNAFKSCVKLATVKGGAALETIGESAFQGDKALKAFTLNKNVSSIGKNAFNGCKNLKTITIKTTKLTAKNVGKGAFKGGNSKATFKCPKKNLKAYKKLLVKVGASKKAKFK